MIRLAPLKLQPKQQIKYTKMKNLLVLCTIAVIYHSDLQYEFLDTHPKNCLSTVNVTRYHLTQNALHNKWSSELIISRWKQPCINTTRWLYFTVTSVMSPWLVAKWQSVSQLLVPFLLHIIPQFIYSFLPFRPKEISFPHFLIKVIVVISWDHTMINWRITN